MKGLLITGATGYLGGYACTRLLETTDLPLFLLVRGKDRRHALEKLWKGWQLHLTADQFADALPRLRLVMGDLHADDLGLSPEDRAAILDGVDGILHIAASLNRKSEKACLNTNLRGTLAVCTLARELADAGRLDRFGFVSTCAAAGHRQSEDVGHDDLIDFSRSDYDPYARTKKFGEHLVRTLLPDVRTIVFRPSIVMGDPRHPRTTQFDMLFATFTLGELPVLPLQPHLRVDIVDALWCGHTLADVFVSEDPDHDTYNLSSGSRSVTVKDITDRMDVERGTRTVFAPALDGGWRVLYRLANRAPRRTMVQGMGALFKVFWPYIVYDTVFDGSRAAEAVGRPPASFPDYVGPVYRWCKDHRYVYPYVDLPEGIR